MINLPADIISLIPQRAPFVMVDALLYADEMLARTAFQVVAENILVEGGKFSEAGMVENIAQTAAAHNGYFAKKNDEKIQQGYIGAIKNLQIFSLPNVGKHLITEVKILNQVFNVTIVEGKIFCDDELAAQCEMKIFLNE